MFCRNNLEVLRQINDDCIDLIYLDPPFNKNKTFTAPIGTTAEGAGFKDIFRKKDIKEEELGKLKIRHRKIHSLIKTAGAMKSPYNWCYLAYMAVRLIECHRILKSSGSLYLHCDPTMSHYLKLLLDCIFEEKNFRNEIIWSYASENLSRKKFARGHDTIFFYSKSSEAKFAPSSRTSDRKELAKMYPHSDRRGRYKLTSCQNNADRPNMVYEWKGTTKQWRFQKSTMEKYEKEGSLVYRNNIPKRKTYLNESFAGGVMLDVWTDVPGTPKKSEKTGYPTQKPTALLERIIKASSQEGDVVLDPFCGCATTCVAAEKLKRKWIGIDISEKAFDLVKQRLRKEIKQDLTDWNKKTVLLTSLPQRTDLGKTKPYKHPDNVNSLFSEQEGKCNGCILTGQHSPMMEKRHFHVDHITPKSRGGTSHIENLQLLCGNCNSSKGDKTMEEWIVFKKKQLKNLKDLHGKKPTYSEKDFEVSEGQE